jgi:hypothetical protein
LVLDDRPLDVVEGEVSIAEDESLRLVTCVGADVRVDTNSSCVVATATSVRLGLFESVIPLLCMSPEDCVEGSSRVSITLIMVIASYAVVVVPVKAIHFE